MLIHLQRITYSTWWAPHNQALNRTAGPAAALTRQVGEARPVSFALAREKETDGDRQLFLQALPG